MVGLALAVVAVAVLLHAVGARDYVGFLSGNPTSTEGLVIGGVYVLAWFGAILVAPIVLGAVCLDAACGTIASRLRAWRASRRR